MPKLLPENKFLDLSDYGRSTAKFIAEKLVNTAFTPVHVTFCFMIVGLIGVLFILNKLFLPASIMLVLKSIIDAADGELARVRKKPSYIGRYLDSVFDLLLNFVILFSIYCITNTSLLMMISAFIAIQLQGTVFNYYYSIIRNKKKGGDSTSRIEESSFPKALNGESQVVVNLLFVLYVILYGFFDRIIISLDKGAKEIEHLPNWFMTLTSIYGLGFQLLVIAIMLTLGLAEHIFQFLIYHSLFIIVIIALRKKLLHKN